MGVMALKLTRDGTGKNKKAHTKFEEKKEKHLNCESFIRVDIVCNSCVAPPFSFEWNKEVLDNFI